MKNKKIWISGIVVALVLCLAVSVAHADSSGWDLFWETAGRVFGLEMAKQLPQDMQVKQLGLNTYTAQQLAATSLTTNATTSCSIVNNDPTGTAPRIVQAMGFAMQANTSSVNISGGVTFTMGYATSSTQVAMSSSTFTGTLSTSTLTYYQTVASSFSDPTSTNRFWYPNMILETTTSLAVTTTQSGVCWAQYLNQ